MNYCLRRRDGSQKHDAVGGLKQYNNTLHIIHKILYNLQGG